MPAVVAAEAAAAPGEPATAMQVASTATCEATSTSPDTAHHAAAMIPIEPEYAAPSPSVAGSAIQPLATMDSALDDLFGRSERRQHSE